MKDEEEAFFPFFLPASSFLQGCICNVDFTSFTPPIWRASAMAFASSSFVFADPTT